MTAPAWPALLTICLALLSLPAAADQADILQASSLTADGSVHLDSSLAGLEFWGSQTPLGAEPARPAAGLTLSAAQVAMESLVSDQTVHAVNPASTGIHTEWSNQTDVKMVGTENREEYWVTVFPVQGHAPPRLVEDTACGEAAPSTATSLPYAPNKVAPTQNTPDIDVSGSLRWTDCAATGLHVRGDFLLTLWQWDAILTAQGHETVVRSGEIPLVPLPGSTPGYPEVTVSQDRQVLFHVTDGDFTLPDGATAPNHVVYLASPTLHVLGSVTLEDAKGPVAVTGQVVDQARLELRGDLAVTTFASQGTIPLQVAAAHPASTTTSVLPHVPSPLWITAVLLLAVVAAVPASRRRLLPARTTAHDRSRAAKLASYAETLVAEGDYRKARALLDKAVRLDGLQPDFRALRARCRSALSDAEGALADHQQAHEGFPLTEPDARASNAFEAARTCQKGGLPEKALAWFRLAVQYDPGCMQDALDDPTLLPLLSRLSRRPQRVPH